MEVIIGSITARLEIRLNEVNVQKSTHVNIKKLAEMAVNALCEVDVLYEIATTEAKRYLVSTLFPDKITYAEGACRTPRLNRGAELIYLENKALPAKKKGQKPFKKSLPYTGWLMVQISTKFVADLKRLAEMPRRMKEFEELGKLMNMRF